jgi:two-component system phosphate regulon response regulator PhoB
MLATVQRNSLNSNTMRDQKRILIVDDAEDLLELLEYNLQRAGFVVRTASNGRAALDQIAKETPDLVVLDLMMPGISGTEVLRRLRSERATAGVPVIILTAKSEEADQIVGLGLGADDYVTKPYSVQVLLARIDAVLRRAEKGEARSQAEAGPGSLRLGGVELDLATYEARVDGEAVSLTLTEFRLLSALLEARGSVLTRAALMGRAMGPGILVTERTIDVHITAIRRKLGAHAGMIRTVRGVGYRAALTPGDDEI